MSKNVIKDFGVDLGAIVKNLQTKVKKMKKAKAEFYTLDGFKKITTIPLPAPEIYRMPLTTYQAFTYMGPAGGAWSLNGDNFREYILINVKSRKKGKRTVKTYVYRERSK
jgi:hypothetical protein